MPADLPNSAMLPEPSAEECQISARLTALIREEIDHKGSIPFSRFMELALYAPGLGYYAAGKRKFGAEGDFITAPESFPLFGRCIARTAMEVLENIADGDILEAGAGSGKLAATLLEELDSLGALPKNYYILELSAELRDRQTQTIKQHVPAHYERVQWVDHLPAPGFRGVVLANELLDAMPVERFEMGQNDVMQLHVTWKGDNFAWTVAPANAAIVQRVGTLGLPSGYTSEIGFAAEGWIRSIAERLEAGVVLLIDYGYPRTEYYHPDRTCGTVMCHYHHRTHPDPLMLVGLQDITAHVDFTAIAEAGTEAGLDLIGYTSQAAFLIGSGLETFLADSDPSNIQEHLMLTNQIKKLTLPHEMGELYKVIALGRETKPTLRGFRIQDRRDHL